MCPSGMARHGERSISMENQAVSGTKKPLFGGRKPLFTWLTTAITFISTAKIEFDVYRSLPFT